MELLCNLTDLFMFVVLIQGKTWATKMYSAHYWTLSMVHCFLTLCNSFIVQPLNWLWGQHSLFNPWTCSAFLPYPTGPDLMFCRCPIFLCVDDLWKLQIVDCSKMDQFLFNGNIWLGMGKMIRDSSVKNLSRAKVQVTLPVSTAFQLNWGLN